ncbi:hypothetical protein E4U33_007181, partial [Claviceps sp. LM78 group G4]
MRRTSGLPAASNGRGICQNVGHQLAGNGAPAIPRPSSFPHADGGFHMQALNKLLLRPLKRHCAAVLGHEVPGLLDPLTVPRASDDHLVH